MGADIREKYFQGFVQAKCVRKTVCGIEIDLDAERLRVDVLDDEILRIKISREGCFDESPTVAVCADTTVMRSRYWVEESVDQICLLTSSIKLIVWKSPFRMDAFRMDGSVIFESDRDENGNYCSYATLNDEFMMVRRFQRADGIYGLGEKTGGFNRNGRTFTLWNTDVLNPTASGEFTAKFPANDPRADPCGTEFDPYYVSIPFYYHMPHMRQEMAGFFIDNGYRGYFDFSDPYQFRIRFEGGQYTEYVFAGPSMREILKAYTLLTGRMQAPPIWALGNHQCRWFPYTQQSFEALGAKYRKRNIPCDVLWLDIGYMDGYRVFTWDKAAFPDVPQMLDGLRQSGFRVISIVDPGIKYESGYEVFEEARSKDLLCKTQAGSIYTGQVWPGRTAFPDFSLSETRQWWGERNAKHVESGLAGIWNDMNEPATGEILSDAMSFGRGRYPHARFHNQYATLMAMATTQGLLAASPMQRTFVLSRAGSAGIQRYAANWMGDNCSSWGHLQMSVPMALGFGVSGQPFLGADVGGFMYSNLSPELLSRWYQYGALTPFCRNHNCLGQTDQYPWVFGEVYEEICRKAIELRYRLMPYIYSQFMLSTESGAPIQAPLIFEFQDDPTTYHIDDQYLLGSDLLVAPVMKEGETSRQVYLPDGTWHDWHTGETLIGRTWISAPAPRASVPVYARGGSIIPMWTEAPASTMEYQPTVIELHVFVPQEDGEWHSILHEDDGVTFAFQSGDYLRTEFRLQRSSEQIVITGKITGKGFREFCREEFCFVFHGLLRDKVEVDGLTCILEQGRVSLSSSLSEFRIVAEAPANNVRLKENLRDPRVTPFKHASC